MVKKFKKQEERCCESFDPIIESCEILSNIVVIYFLFGPFIMQELYELGKMSNII